MPMLGAAMLVAEAGSCGDDVAGGVDAIITSRADSGPGDDAAPDDG